MGLFDFFRGADINAGVEEWKNTPSALLLDVRTAEEYAMGRIGGSVNLPLSELRSIDTVAPQKDLPIFVYCHSGARSARAVSGLCQLGYTQVKDIGGIAAYKGKVER